MLNRILAALALLFALAVGYAVATAKTRPVLLSITTDPALVRPRNRCIMNPFRDPGPERVAERFLEAVRNKDFRALVEMQYEKVDNEVQWPIRRWRIGRRTSEGETTRLMYWVVRGNGYPADEEEVHLTVRHGRVVDFNAIY